jgi:hypothetical protein
MKLELIIFGATAFLLYNAYHDGKYTKVFSAYKKYYKMATIALVALSLYLLLKRNPDKSKQMLLYTNNLVKYMPIDKNTMDMITPIFDFTSKSNNNFMGALNGFQNQSQSQMNPVLAAQQQRMSLSGQKGTKRSVSETKKKYVAYNQDWKCGHCNNKLTHTFEVDHKIRLEHGGGNDPSNLVALCRECHGQKTASENM